MRWPAQALPVSLAALAVGASRYLSRPRSPDDYDAIGFVLALGDYDLGRLQPHPPGYPVYVALGRAAQVLVASPLAAATLVSAASAGVTAAALWWAVARVASTRAAWMALVLYGGAALPWITGAAALSDGTAAALAAVGAALWVAESPLASGVAVGLMLGARASYLPLAVSWMVLVTMAQHAGWLRRALAGAAVGVALWAMPFVWVVGGRALVAAAGHHLRGHFVEWGGSIATQPDIGARAAAFARDLFFDGIAPAGWALVLLAATVTWAALRMRRPGANPCSSRAVTALLVTALPYATWVFFAQNVIEQPRHLLPLVILLVAVLAPVLAGSAAASVASLAAVYAVSLPLAMAHHASEAPGAQLAAWAAAWYPPREVVLFGGRSMRFVRHLAPSLATRDRTWLAEVDVDLERLARLPRHVLVTSEVEPDARRRSRLRAGPRFCRDPRLERREPCLQVYEYDLFDGARP